MSAGPTYLQFATNLVQVEIRCRQHLLFVEAKARQRGIDQSPKLLTASPLPTWKGTVC
jgi:hypothetical protein